MSVTKSVGIYLMAIIDHLLLHPHTSSTVKSNATMSEISDDDDASYNLPDDEVREIKRAMRVAKARKQSLSMQMKHKIDRNSADRNELESIIRKQSAELARTQSLLSQADFDLKEARYEINRINEREIKVNEEKRLIETKSKDVIAELKHQLQQKTTSMEERNQVAVYECDKLIKTLTSLYKSVFDGRGTNASAPKTTKQLLDKAAKDAEQLKGFLTSRSAVAVGEEQDRISAALQNRLTTNTTADQGCDNALLDMCRSLEEENRALTDTVEALKVQLAEASRDASINRLIPHYRLAIVRSRTYAANLLEQVKREQATSQTLREQLDATYIDLKKVVEEKRRLFTRMSKYSLQQEEKDSFLAHQREVDERRILEASHTLASSPLRQQTLQQQQQQQQAEVTDVSSGHQYFDSHHSTSTSTVPRTTPAQFPAASSVPSNDYLLSGLPTSAPTEAPAVPRPQSAYLKEVLQSSHIPSARTSTESNTNHPLSSQSHLKAELSQLDLEIEQLKEKLGKAAMLRSQRILSEVLDAHAPLIQLQSVRKSFVVLVCGSWQAKTQKEFEQVLVQRIGLHSLVLFRLIVEVNSDAEEYCINSLELRSLPSLVCFSNGAIQDIVNLANGMAYTSDLAACRNPEFINEKLIRYDPSYNPIMNLVGSELNLSASSQSIGQLFLSGDRSSVGKSSMCLAILVSLLRKGVPPSALAYIKPVTQCEADQPVTVFCNRVGISNRGIGPVVFYKGFTRAYLNGETAPAEALLDEAHSAVAEISQRKMFTLVDGVGYPSVGSICNLSNADVAKKLNAPVLLVGKSGVGDAVDSYNLNSAYFELKGVRVLGGVFNKLPLDGYYSLDNCKDAVSMYFQQFKPLEMPYGFVPTIDAKPTDNKSVENNDISNTDSMDVSDSKDTTAAANSAACSIEYTEFETQLSDALLAHVDLDRLIHDVWMYEIMKNTEDLEQQMAAANLLLQGIQGNINYCSVPSSRAQNHPTRATGAYKLQTPFSPHGAKPTAVGHKRSREEVEQEARKQGATGG
eukprot:gene14223-16352_t